MRITIAPNGAFIIGPVSSARDDIMHDKRIVALLMAICIVASLLSGCSGSGSTGEEPGVESSTGNSEVQASQSADKQDIEKEEHRTTPRHEYLDGYEELALYREIAKIESCTNPEELCSILMQLYGEEASFMEIEYDPEGEFLFQVVGLYNVEKAKAPVTEDVYAFFIPYNEAPVFIMDSSGAYPVSKYEINSRADGGHIHSVSAWLASDLFLCLHSYADCEGDSEDRATLADAVQSMEWYMEYEARVMLSSLQNDPSAGAVAEIKPEDERAELLIPVMNGTLATLVNEMAQQAIDISKRQEVTADLEPLYAKNTQILDILNSIRDVTVVGRGAVNDLEWSQYDTDLYKVLQYTEDFIITANEGFYNQEYAINRITEYKTLCEELTDPLTAAILYLKMN